MRDWFDSLAFRERIFVASGGAVVLVALFWALIWLPIDRGRESAAESVATWERSLAELRPLKTMAGTDSRQSGPRIDPGQAPVVIVDRTLRARGLDRSLKRSQPTTSTGIRVEFENVAFDDLVLWLGDLSNQYAMDVQAGSFSKSARTDAGRINASLTLERRL